MVRWAIDEARYVLQRRHKIDAADLMDAPGFLARTLISNVLYGELSREEMIRTYPTWRYGEEAVLDTTFLTETQDERRGITYEDVPDGITVEQPFVSRIVDEDEHPVFVGHEKPLALTPNHQVIRELAKNNRSQINALFDQLMPLEWLPTYLKLRLGQTTASHIDSDVLPLFQRKYPNYYHWVMDELPKVRALEHYPRDATIVLSSDPRPYVTASLDRLGFEYVYLTEELTSVDSILAPINRNPKFVNLSYVDDEYLLWLRHNVLKNIEGAGRERSERIYISRENSGARRLHNREQLLDALSELGFESYTLESRPFEENVALFANAEVIVSPHGAGLTDIIFADTADVVELSPLANPPPAFFLLADQLGHGYHHVSCTPVDDGEYDIQRNMRADVDEVVSLVRSILG